MAGETTTTVVGRLTADPDLRYTPAGAAVASFTVPSTPRNYDRQTGEWKDGDRSPASTGTLRIDARAARRTERFCGRAA